jgi:hypothetical protein
MAGSHVVSSWVFASLEVPMPERFTVQAINSVLPDAATDLVHIECQMDDEQGQLDVHAGALSTLVLGLRQAAEAFSVSETEFSGQPLELTGTALVSLQDGTVMLQLVLDGSLRVVVNVPDPALASLQECLFAMGEIRRPLSHRITKH